MRFLRTNTAVIVTVGPFYDKTDGVTIETALTITNERITLTADTDAGSAPTNILDNVTGATAGTSNDLNYISGNDAGMMQLELAAADTNRLGRMFLSITDAANHVPVFHEFMVLPAMIYDAFILGTDVLDSSMTQILGTAVSAPATAGILDVNVKNIDNDAASASGTVTFPNATLASTANITAAAGITLADGAITAAKIAADAITDAKVASDVTIASVTGAVGSVTGNVGGNVVGSVASVTAGVTLAASAVQAIWDALTSALTTVGSIGKLLVDNVNATISSRLATAGYTAPSNLTAAQIATGVWQDTTAGDFTTALSVGKSVMNGVSLGTGLTVASVFGAVGSVTGAVGSVTGLTASNLDATISSRASAANLATAQTSIDDLPTNAELATSQAAADDATLAAIAALNNLSAVQVNAEVDTALADYDAPTHTELTAELATADDAVLAQVALVKAVTDKLDDTLEDDAGTFRFTANALEQAPSGGGSIPTVSEIADEVQTRTIAAVTTVNGLAANSVTAAALAADAGTELGTAVWASATRRLSDGTNIALAKGVGVTGFNDLDAAGVRTAVGLASASMDTQLDALPTNAEIATAFGLADDATLAAIAALSIPTANQNADALLDRADAIEVGLTPRQSMRLLAAIAAGKLSGGATTTNTIRNAVADSKNRIVATVDADGNRSAVAVDLT